MSALIYLAAGSFKCITGPGMSEDVDTYDVCGGILTPQTTITVTLTLFFYFEVVAAPLQETKYTLRDVIRMRVSFKAKVSLRMRSPSSLFNCPTILR